MTYNNQFQTTLIQLQYNALEFEKSNGDTSKKLVYENQRNTALHIVDLFISGILAITLIAQPQVGKTGCILSILMEFCINSILCTQYSNIYVITGMSDTDWEEQTKNSFLPLFRRNVIHRSNLHKYIDQLKNLTNGLICIDESHFGSGKHQTISKELKLAGLLNLDTIMENNIKILFISATPGAILDDVVISMGDYHQKVILNPPISYVGFRKLLENENMIETMDIDINIISDIWQIISNRWGDNPKFHIFRITYTKYTEVFNLFHKFNNDNDNLFSILEHNSHDRQEKDFMDTKPDEHTFVFIKGFWRASKQLNDTYVGIAYESPTDNPDTNTISQGLSARLLGNDKQTPSNVSPLIFTHINSILQYLKLIDENADYTKIDVYNSTTLTIEDGVVIKKQRSLAHISNINDNYIPQPTRYNYISDFLEFDNVEELNLTAKMLSTKSHMTKPDSYLKNGYYCNNIPGYKSIKCPLHMGIDIISSYKPESLLNKKQMDNNTISKVVLPCYNEYDEVIWILRFGSSLNNPNLDKDGFDNEAIDEMINTKKYRLQILGSDKIKLINCN